MERQGAKSYDVVVIGAGNGGLAAAIRLAWAGVAQVLLCDFSDFRLNIARNLGFATCNNAREDPYEVAQGLFGTAYGLQGATGIDLPAEPAHSLYYTADRMGPVELASCSFGQSSKVSFIGMAAAVAAIVNGGRLMRPYVVAEVYSPSGELLQQNGPTQAGQAIRPETSALMRQMMEAVVVSGGGQKAQIPGYRVGGKSGTSQKLDSDDPTARIASFVAVAPIDDPQLLCLVCIDEPHSWTTAGGTIAAPVCAEVLEQALVYRGVPRTAVPAAPALAELPADGDSLSGE